MGHGQHEPFFLKAIRLRTASAVALPMEVGR